MEGTPKVILGKAEPNLQEVWIDDLKTEPVTRLKEANNSEKAQFYAKTIVLACSALSQSYGYFIINENMIFMNSQKEIFESHGTHAEILDQPTAALLLDLKQRGQLDQQSFREHRICAPFC